MRNLKRVKLAIAIANEAIGERREELSKVEQQQARALTAAEVERNRGELYAQQQSQGREGLERLTQEQKQGAEEAAALEDTLATLERECAEREQVFAVLDQEMKELVQQRTAALAEEERGRRDVLNLAVLLGILNRLWCNWLLRIQEAADREGRLAREREDFRYNMSRQRINVRRSSRPAMTGAIGRRSASAAAGCRGRERAPVDELAEVDQSVFRQSEELAAVDSHLRALQGVLQKTWVMGGAATKNRRHSKPVSGFAMPLPSGWLCLPDGTVPWKRSWRAGQGMVRRHPQPLRGDEFLKGKDLGRGTFIRSNLAGSLVIRRLAPGGLRWRACQVWSDVRSI